MVLFQIAVSVMKKRKQAGGIRNDIVRGGYYFSRVDGKCCLEELVLNRKLNGLNLG